MKLYRFTLALILTTGLSGCYSIESTYSFDSETDFSSLKSYTWLAVGPEVFSTTESTEHYISAMDDMLAAKGFNLNPDDPDFLISTQRAESHKEQYETLSGTVEFSKSMLRVELLNPSSKKVIFAGEEDAYFEEDETQDSKNVTIDRAVEALLSEFPPGG